MKRIRKVFAVLLCLTMLSSLLVSVPASAQGTANAVVFDKVDLTDVDTLSGYLYERASANYDRLESSIYQLPGVFTGDGNWPGDYQGRALLGVICEAKALHQRAPLYLEQMMSALDSYLINGTFFNEAYDPELSNEQLFAGHSWFLRSMCELYDWNGDERAYTVINNLVGNLLIAAKDAIARYPVQHTGEGGGESGEIGGEKDGWKLSTDTGCLFIMLDGATHAYEITQNEQLKSVIETMIEKFMEADVVGLKYQTHATLSATRGLLRFYDCTGEQKYLDYAVSRMEDYMASGMTEAYMNYNWFQRPEWTEPCAIIDSYICAMEIYRATGELQWLELAQKILYNGMGASQRINGGFGCDNCAGSGTDSLRVHAYEATWCCTMRGGEGMSKAVGYQYLTDADNALYAVQYGNNTIRHAVDGGTVVLSQTSNYPESGDVSFVVDDAAGATEFSLNLFIPSYVDMDTVTLKINGGSAELPAVQNGYLPVVFNPQEVTSIDLHFDIPVLTRVTDEGHTRGYVTSKGFAELGWFGSASEQTPIYERFHLSDSANNGTPVRLIDTAAGNEANCALGCASSASSGAADAAVDGNWYQGWTSDVQASADSAQWITLDLGAVLELDRIALYPADKGRLTPVRYAVELSADKAQWQAVKTVSNAAASEYLTEITVPDKTSARYVRIRCTELRAAADGYAAGFAEIAVYPKVKTLTIATDNGAVPDKVLVNGQEKDVPCEIPCVEGAPVTVEIVPGTDAFFGFYGWSGAIESGDASVQLNMTEDQSLTILHGYTREKDVAFGGAVTASSSIVSLPDWSPQNLTDGRTYADPNAKVSKGYTSGFFSSQDTTVTLTLDLGENKTFNCIDLYPRNDYFAADGSTGSFPQDFTISVKADGADNFTTVKSVTGMEAPFGGPAAIGLDGTQTARYILLTVTKLGKPMADSPTQYALQLAELSAYLKAPQSEYGLTIDGQAGTKAVVNGKKVSLPYEGRFAQGEAVTVEAAQSEYTALNGWSGDLVSSEATLRFLMKDNWNLKVDYTVGKLLDHSHMTASATSETNPRHDNDGPASFAIDGDTNTLWHTQYSPTKDELPQSITLSFDDVYSCGRFVYEPRKDTNSTNGIVTAYRLEGQLEDGSWVTLSEGSWAADNENKEVSFDPVMIQAIRLTALEGVGGYACCSELNVYVMDQEQPQSSITAQADPVTVNELFEVTAVTPDTAAGIRLYNEYGLRMGLKELTASDNGDGTVTWTFKTSVGTAGQGRTFILALLDESKEETMTEASFAVDVVAAKPAIYSASIEETATVNQPVTLTVVTSRNTAGVNIFNEYGLKMGTLSRSYKDTEEGRVWTIQIKIGTKGTRVFKVQAKNAYGDVSEWMQTNQIIVSK